MKATNHRLIAAATCTALGVGLAAKSYADDSVETLAKQLVELRSTVEQTHEELESERKQHYARMTSLTQRRAELEADVQRRELELKKLQQAISVSDRERDKARADADALRPLVAEVIKSLSAHLDAALPFKLEDRRAGLTEIKSKLDKGELSAPRALNQLWTFVEDELRLARENGLFQQTIARDGKEELADVIRIGMVMLFFRTNDGAYGYANKSGDAWSYTTLDPAAAKPLGDLFDAFQKQVRTGYFVIPNALPEVKQ